MAGWARDFWIAAVDWPKEARESGGFVTSVWLSFLIARGATARGRNQIYVQYF